MVVRPSSFPVSLSSGSGRFYIWWTRSDVTAPALTDVKLYNANALKLKSSVTVGAIVLCLAIIRIKGSQYSCNKLN